MAFTARALSCNDRRLLRVIHYVIGDLTRQPLIAELASIAGLERTYFSRHFQRTIGFSFSMWNRHIRMERARHLLASTDLPITGIAMAVGYADVTTFERNFRRCLNASPRHYRVAQRRIQVAQNITIAAQFAELSAHKATARNDGGERPAATAAAAGSAEELELGAGMTLEARRGA